jgi:DNA cross-link repair 1C protein
VGRVSGGLSDILLPQAQDDGDAALKNLVGNGAAEAAARWADDGKLLKKLDVVRSHLDAEHNAVIDHLLGISKPASLVGATSAPTRQDKGKSKAITPRYGRESDGDTDFSDSDDERGRTAHLLFASLAGIEEKENAWWVSSSPSQKASDVDVLHEQSAPIAGPSSRKSGGGSREPQGGDASRRKNRLFTPVSSPIRPRPMKPSPLQMKMKALQPSPPLSTPQRFGKLSPIGRGYTLSSPIYILSSSPQAMHSSHSLPGGKGLASEPPTKAGKPRASPSTRSLLTKTNSQIINRQAPAVETTPVTKKAGHKASRIELKPISHSPFFTPKNLVALSSNMPANLMANPKTPTKSARKRVAHELPAEAVDLKRPRLDPPKARPSTPRAKNIASSSKKAAARGSSSSTRTPLPLSPVMVPSAKRQRSELQLQRIRIGERLAQARPDLNAPTYEKKRASLMARYSTMEEVPQKEIQRGKGKERPSSPTPTPIRPVVAREKTILSFETVDDDDGGMDWNRSRELAAQLKEDIANGRRPMLPGLLCAESQSQEWESGSGSGS